MPIDVYQLKDLFWDNNSYRVPNAIPTQFKRKQRFNKKAKIHDYFGGVIRLEGDYWNWARYKGVYYFLKIVKVLDQDKKICLYALIRDTWCCLLEKGIIVRGDISTWNIDKDLEEHLNKCLPSLETHARIERLALSEDKEKWLDKLGSEVTPIEADLKQRVLTLRTWEWFLRRIRDEEISKYKSAREYFYRDRNELFLFGVVNGELIEGWKEKVKEKINNWINQINDSNTVLVKVGSVSGYSTNKLLGHYALCPKNAKGGILGSPDTTQKVTKIDLSGCTDLRLVRWDDLSIELEPNQDLLTKGFIDTDQELLGVEELLGTKLCWKVSRRLMLPIGSQTEKKIDEVIPGDTAWMSYKTQGYYPDSFFGAEYREGEFEFQKDNKKLFERRYKYWIKNEKQFIRFKDREGKKKEEGFLYWVDKLDFVLSWRNNRTSGEVNQTEGTYRNSQLYRYFGDIWRYRWAPTTALMYGGTTGGPYFYNLVIPHWPFDDSGYVWIKDRVKPAPCYGLLLFQTIRPYRDWEGWEYIGERELNHLSYYSGFNKTFWEVYGANSYRFWFNDNSDTWRSLKEWAGKKGGSLSRFMLYLDGIAFRLFTPDFYEYNYRYDWYNVWKINDIATTPKYYVYEQLQNDYGSGSSKWTNPFKNKETYIQYVDHKRNPAIERVTIRDRIDFPFTIKKGDYFFTSLEYYIRNYDSNFWLLSYDSVSGLKNKTALWDYQTLRVLGDWINCRLDKDYKEVNKDDPGLNDETIKNNFEENGKTGKVVICTDNKGKLEVRILKTFKKVLNLAEGDSNIVESVNEETFKEVRFFHLSKQDFGVDRFTDLENTIRLNLLHVFYNVNGTTTNRVSNRFLWLTNEELESSNIPYLIDLVGTGFYACLKNGDIHLIAKDLQFIEEIEKEASIQYSLETQSVGILQRLQNLTLLEKINQMNVINYKTLPFPLQGKFKFDGKDDLTIKISGLKADNLQSTQDHFLIECKTEVDEISNVSSITKKPVQNIAFLPEQIQLDTLRLQQERADEDLALQLSEHRDFAKEKIKIARERAEYDLNYEWYSRLADSIGTGISFFTKTGATLMSGGAAAAASSGLLKQILSGEVFTKSGEGADKLIREGKRLSTLGKTAAGIGTAGKALGFLGSIVDNVGFYAWRYPEQQRRIKEDEAIQLKEVAYASFKFDQTHFRRKQDSKLQLNNISRSYIRENVNDVALSEKFIQKKNLADTYLTIYLPSEEQLVYLERDREEYGVDCDIPDKQVHIKNGMPANIMRFRNLRDEGFIGIDNANEREFLKARLEIGLKIVEIEPAEAHDFIFIEDKRAYENRVRNLSAEIQNLKYQLSTEEIAKYKEILENCKQEKAEIEETKKRIESDIAETNKQLEDKKKEVRNIQTELAASKRETAKAKEDATKQAEQATKRIQSLTTSLANKNTEIKNKAGQIENLKNVRTTLTNEKNALNEENERNKQSLEQLRAQNTALQGSYDTTTRQLQEAQQELARLRESSERETQGKDTQLRDLQERIQALTEERDKTKSDLDTSRRQVGNLATTISTLNRDKKDQASRITQLEGEKEQEKTAKETAERQREAIQKSYDDAIRAEQEANKQKNDAIQSLSQLNAELAAKKEQIRKCQENNQNLRNKLIAKPRKPGRPMQYWDLCDFLEEFKKVNFDYSEMGKTILKASSYGLNSSELNLYLWTLEYIDQILEMITKFEEDNVTFLIDQSDDKAREELLKPENQEKIKKIRGVVTCVFLKALGRRLTDQEWGQIYRVQGFRKLFEDKILDQEIKTVQQTNKTGIFDVKYPETMKEFELTSFSNLQTKKMLKDRYWDVTGDFDNSIWNRNVYYDIVDTYKGWQFGRILFAAYKRWQESYHENNMHNLHKKVSVDDLFNIYHNDTSNYLAKGLGYEGRKGRQLYLGFIILHIIRTIAWIFRKAEPFYNDIQELKKIVAEEGKSLNAEKFAETIKEKWEKIFKEIRDYRSLLQIMVTDKAKSLAYMFADSNLKNAIIGLSYNNVSQMLWMDTFIDAYPEPLLDGWNVLYSIVCEQDKARAKRAKERG